MDQHKEELATLEAIDSGAVYTLASRLMSGSQWRPSDTMPAGVIRYR